jgi:16S rRNA (adenine1518-N6/adenine1519-N6)-dimethyltransferase
MAAASPWWEALFDRMNLKQIRELLDKRNIQLTKSLGQNFLHDANQLKRIVAAGEVKPGDKVLEIGPGLGPLTAHLLAAGADVLAIEMDARLVEVLRERFGLETGDVPSDDSSVVPDTAGEEAAGPQLGLLHADALKELQQRPRDWSEWKLVANLPYSVASPILVELAQSVGCPERLVATLQLEVAQRIMAKGNDDDYGKLSLLVQVRYEPKEWFKIPASCFFPMPNVDSACVTLVRRNVPLLEPGAELKRFTRLVKHSFSQRRKMMLKLLRDAWREHDWVALFEQCGVSKTIRAEALPLEKFVELVKAMGPEAPAEADSTAESTAD